ncbi:MAG TPA: DNA polymerase III subunit alpha, partial [Rhodospirillales bacterium]|nr:DNA polymerase III subunit alpha [Rhodospirillales bacterium]
VQRKYGADRVAHIITFGKLQARAVLRDVGRVLGLPFGLVDRICKLVPHNPANPPSLDQALEMEPRLREYRDRDPNVARMIDIARKLEGLPRHASTHAAGVVIGDRPLSELVPLYRDPRSDMPVTQFDMKDVEKAGLVKFDFLGLTTLTMLRLAQDLVRARGVELDLDRLGLDDPATYALLGRAETAGVFQLESSGMRDALKKLRPDCFEDIIAMVSLYRPGPMDNIPRYINVKHGIEQASYLHPALAPILEETNGVIIYQEQVMEIAKQLAGYSLGGADLLRRAMGKKIKAEMDAQREVFVRGAAERGIPEDRAAAIFEQVAKFASYGFNKSHAAAYALLAYQTAYLKANHPVEFYAAVLTMEMANQDKLAAYRQEMRRQGIPLYPPDINTSADRFLVEDGAEGAGVRYALAALKGVGIQAVRAIVAERERGGPFADLFDLAARVGTRILNRRLLEALVRAGAFDRLEPNRRRLFEAIEAALRYAQAWAASEEDQQASLFGGEVIRPRRPALPDCDDWSQLERLREEASVVGFYLSAHPLDAYASELERLEVVPAAALFDDPAAFEGRRVRLAGVVIGKQERTGGRSRYAFVQLSDASAQFEVTVFADLLARSRELLEGQAPLLIEADARVDGGEVKLVAQRVEPLEFRAGSGGTLELRVTEPATLAALARIVERGGRGGLRLRLALVTGKGEEVLIDLPAEWTLPWPNRPDVERLPGVTAVQEAPALH